MWFSSLERKIVDLKKVVDLSFQAGEAVLEIYESGDINLERKEDRSPLTLADKRSHEIIVNGLESLCPGIPVLSEEGQSIPYETRKHAAPLNFEHAFWCTVTASMATEKTSPSTKEQRIFLSGTKVREMLRNAQLPPPEFTRPEVAEILSEWASTNGRKEQEARDVRKVGEC